MYNSDTFSICVLFVSLSQKASLFQGVGYEMWLMAEARKRNPGILLYGLPLSWPAWVGNGAASPFADVALPARYVTKWCTGAKRVWNVSVDYIGLWNERPCE